MKSTRTILAMLVVVGSFNFRAAAQTPPTTPPSTRESVTREEYEKLKSEMEAMRREMKAAKEATVTKEEVDQTIEEIEKDLKTTRGLADDLRLGTSKFLITGYTFAGFSDRQNENSS
ncbi:MAG: hypothetical protein ABIP55_09545, partial [Tepidisphaeraceae bacterium]